ncbi:collagen-like protein [Maribacter algarum]|uniref:Collagen-like protein n=1 Tax=Maribacter algarum (ex Zhang et al. 2020) TaxID=2578118 RepID=A0A5S3QF64_9FLAO|nr:collagen-like protein [Maribacter algarum]TMM55907.1 collagen-like protein [Maribacter algarum]
MKKATLILGAFLTLFMVSCEVNGLDGRDGLDGLDGRDGLDGQDGVNILANVIDIEGDFTPEGDYRILYEFPDTIEVFETDLVLVYILFDQTEDSNGEAIDIWRLLPQTLIVDQGLLQYNFDHTFLDVSIFLEADFDLGLLLPGDTEQQVFRIAVVPGEKSGKSSLDHTDIEAVMAHIGVSEKDVSKVKL